MRRSRADVIGGALLVMGAVASAQETGEVPAPAPGRTYAFEVASVKPSPPEDRLRVFDFKPAGSLTARNQTLRALIAAAYGTPFPIPLPDERIVGGPAWLGTARFSIEARSALPPASETAARDIGFMLRTLLAERFGLRVRLEPRPQRVYALTPAPAKKNRRITLRPAEADCLKEHCGIGGGPGRIELRGAPLDLIVFVLAEAVGRPVVNRAGLDGLYDGTLEWAATPEEAGASIFTALDEQFGLTLRDARAPLETLVVSHAERPTAD